MKYLVYGCGFYLKCFFAKEEFEFTNIDFADSNPELVGTEIVTGKKILAREQISASDYDLCIIGSLPWKDEIRKVCLEIGFEEWQLVSTEYIVSLWERWKKYYFHGTWKNVVSKQGIEVISNWKMVGTDGECLIKIENSILNTLLIRPFSFYNFDKKIQIFDADSGECLLEDNIRNSIELTIQKQIQVLKIVLTDIGVLMPWCAMTIKKSEQRKNMEACRLSAQMLQVLKTMENYPFYDEDYTLISGETGGTILDVGANYGQSMYSFAHICKSNIVSIEVVPDLYDVLLQLKLLIDKDNRIEIINEGISEKAEELDWFEPSDPMVAGSFDKAFIEGRRLQNVNFTVKKMMCRPLDELVGHIDDIWMLKIDVEGLELEAIRGASSLIAKNFPLILIEQNEKTKDIIELLEDKYELFYYNPVLQTLHKNRISRLNCWLIPKEEYRTDRINRILQGKLIL